MATVTRYSYQIQYAQRGSRLPQDLQYTESQLGQMWNGVSDEAGLLYQEKDTVGIL